MTIKSPRRRVALGSLLLCAFVALLSSLAAPGPTAAQRAESEGLPPGTRVETVLEGMRAPVAMAFDPAGRLFYTEKTGAVRLFANGQLQPNPVITFQVNSDFERGLLGIAISPNFSTDRFIYVYYTNATRPDSPERENRVVRFTERDGVGSNPTTLFTASQTAGNHVGGNLHFGPDGKLYVTIGDNGNPENGQDLQSRNGKIHRLNPDGSAPGDNPRFEGGSLPTIYAYGLRNSFDFTFDPVVAGRIFASENGPGCDDEMNRIEAGFNYGWRSNYPCDGANPDRQFNSIAPLWTTGGSCCLAPTGIEVYKGNQIPQWRNHIFMANYNGGGLYHFTPNADRTVAPTVRRVDGVIANMDILTGPDGALYYIEGGGYQSGTLKRIVGQAAQPTATARPGTPVPGTPGPAPTIPGSGSRQFPETGRTVRGLFLEYWDRNGRLPQQGFPISELMAETSDLNGRVYTVQYFERAVFEYHPENQPPFNVLLSQVGTFRYRQKYPQGAPNQKPNTQPNSVVFPETGKRVGGRFLEYWRANGGLAQQGFPISDEFTEKSDLNGQTYIVQYFERAVFEFHPENQPPFDVLLSQLGTFRYREKYQGR
jgi:glucose/arabinose dehydrogenase